MYLTDIVKLAVEENLAVERYLAQSPVDVLGVNSRIELAGAQNELQMRRNRTLMLQGVTINNPQTVTVSPESSIERDTLLEPLVSISAGSRIGHSCRIGQGTLLQGCNIANNVTIGPYSCLSGTTVAAGTILPPFSKT